MTSLTPEARARRVIERCAGCGHCRDLMEDASCLFMPELFRLSDREAAGGEPILPDEMKLLIGLCNTCGICPCVPVQTWIHEARDAFVERDGLPRTTRLIEDVQRIGHLGGALPRLANAVTGQGVLAKGVKRVIGIHPDRRLPRFPQEGFTAWANERGLTKKPTTSGRKVAYFVGCTARYFFPEVAKATIEVLQHNGVAVYLPEQQCCGMPTLLEGDRKFTFARAHFNVAQLTQCVAEGFDIVCSCPTCGYLLKSMLSDGAQYSADYRALVEQLAGEAKGDMEAVSRRMARDDDAFTGRTNGRSAHGRQPWMLGMVPWKVFADQGYFAEISGLDRLRVANHTYDLGEYLRSLHEAGELRLDFAPAAGRMAYFAPCHQRQQGIGQPWIELLRLLPGLRIETIGDGFDCCGQGGLLGVKKDYHETSLKIGARLFDKINAAAPGRMTTDCLSCRIQFQERLPAEVSHPVEVLRDAYRRARTASPQDVAHLAHPEMA